MKAELPVLGPSVPQEGTRLSKGLGRLGLRLLRWRVEGAFPDIPRCVLIVAPHTSNWDFVVGVAAKLALGLRAHFLAKHTVFRGPFGRLLRWVGGLPVDRAAAGGVVAGAVAAFREREQLFLGLTPEGTRRRVERWKSGFYRIAEGAEVPIVPVAFDYRRRSILLLPPFTPTGHYEADLAVLQSLFTARMARYPDGY